MSELAQITKAIEESQGKMQALFDAQKKEIEATGQISKQLQDDLVKVNDELKTAGTRLFDLEQRLTKGGDDPATTKSFAEQTAEDLIKSWDGKSAKVGVKSFHKALGSGAGSAGALVQPMQMPGILMPGLRRLTIRDLLAQGRTISNAVEYVRENVFTNSAAPVAEGALKPESNLTFTKQTANVRTIAHWVQASKQIMSDAPQLESYLNNRLLYGLRLKEEGQLLAGDGTGDNLPGLKTVATDYDATLNVAGDTMADKIAHAIYQVSESEFEASGIVLHPRDWHSIALMKDAEGRYIFGGPAAFAARVMWGLPVVPTMAQTRGEFTVGGFDMASQIWDNMDASVEVSQHDRDNFVKNMLTILCEERLALAHYRPAAIVDGAFA
ncbi:phage major capsid protein [Pseudomonas sp. zfem003]|uniref:phage major capsid protein n=1 Tax=Pseudomonas sp. zfem003 TaxID=3078198 RepID=UPI002928885E|nr:phage major capsid protein [Pseudomonas sp. zfem003]MDU9400612.1 phage major capsid protein [Pseudomonas sp. zfem003]